MYKKGTNQNLMTPTIPLYQHAIVIIVKAMITYLFWDAEVFKAAAILGTMR